MKQFLLALICAAALMACNNQSQNNDNLTEVELKIEGMSCEKMCGGKICDKLEKMDGVASTDLEFNSENPIDKVTVSYDPNKVSISDLSATVENLANGAYKVKETINH